MTGNGQTAAIESDRAIGRNGSQFASFPKTLFSFGSALSKREPNTSSEDVAFSIGISNPSKLPAQKRTGCLRGRHAVRGRIAAFVQNRRAPPTLLLDWLHPGRCRNPR